MRPPTAHPWTGRGWEPTSGAPRTSPAPATTRRGRLCCSAPRSRPSRRTLGLVLATSCEALSQTRVACAGPLAWASALSIAEDSARGLTPRHELRAQLAGTVPACAPAHGLSSEAGRRCVYPQLHLGALAVQGWVAGGFPALVSLCLQPAPFPDLHDRPDCSTLLTSPHLGSSRQAPASALHHPWHL